MGPRGTGSRGGAVILPCQQPLVRLGCSATDEGCRLPLFTTGGNVRT
jgi:hypothetical protein